MNTIIPTPKSNDWGLFGAVVLVTPPRRRPSYLLKVIVLSDDKPLTAIISEMHCYMQFHNLFQH